MKQFETKSKTINGNTFYIRPFPAFTAANLTGELAALVTPLLGALAPLIGGAGSEKGLMDIDIDMAAPAVAGAFSSLSGDKLEMLMKKLLTKYNNISVELEGENEAQKLNDDLANEIFCGDAQDMFILAFEVIRINFNGFFKKLGGQSGLDAGLFRKMKLPSTTNTENLT